jgi:hypothetical protein
MRGDAGTSLILVVVGVLIEFTAGAAQSTSAQVGKTQAQAGRDRGVPAFYQRLLDWNVESGPRLGLWMGRVIGAAAIVAGIVIAVSS